jgi:hypothetical protein
MKMAPMYDDDEDREHTAALEEAVVAAKTKAVDETNRLNERAAEFRNQAETLRSQSRQLLQDAERLEQREAKVRARAREAKELSESLRFEHLLLRIRNDRILCVDGRTDVPIGRGKALGEALLQNNTVEELHLDISNMLSAEPRTLQTMVDYLSTSNKLTTFGIYNARVDGYVTTTVQKVTDALLEAVAKSSSIQDVTCHAACSASAFAHLTSCRRINRLDMVFADVYSARGQQIIALAFDSFKERETGPYYERFDDLKFKVTNNEELAVSILSNLPKLLELILVASDGCGERYFEALAQYFALKGMPRTVELVDFHLDASSTTNVLFASRPSSVGSDGLPSRLVFRSCSFNAGAAQQLVSLLQAKAIDKNGEVEKVCMMYLFTLSLDGDGWTCPAICHELADSFLRPPKSNAIDSTSDNQALTVSSTRRIGSGICRLDLVNARCEIFDYWSSHADRIEMDYLDLIGLSESACKSLATLLPKLTSVEVVRVANVAPEGVIWIMRVLKESGTVFVANDGDQSFDDAQRRLIDVYTQRNNDLNDHLRYYAMTYEEDDNATSTKMEDGMAVGRKENKDHRMCPTAMKVAMQVSRTRLGIVTRALLHFGSYAGPDYSSGETTTLDTTLL